MKLNPMLVLRESADDTGVIYDPDSESLFELNRSGLLLYKSLLKGCGENQLLDTLRDAYGSSLPPEETVKTEIRNFLHALKSRGWLADEES